MKKQTENQAEEALRYVYECLVGHIKPDYGNACTLMIPDDIADSLEERYVFSDLTPELLDGEYGSFFSITQIYVGKIVWGYHFDQAEVLEEDVRSVIWKYYMLKPSAVTLEKNADGKYAYLSCTLAYGRDGTETKILAETIDEFKAQFKQELDLLIEHHGSRKLKAMYEVSHCLFHDMMAKYSKTDLNGQPNHRIPKLNSIVVPDNLFDNMQICNKFDDAEDFVHWSIGTIKWTTLKKNTLQNKDWHLFNHAVSELYTIIRNILFEFYYLKPGHVTLEIDKTGQSAYLCCTIEYSESGYPWKIKAKTIEDFAFSMQLEAYKLMHDGACSRLEEAKLYAGCCLKGIIPYCGVPVVNNITTSDLMKSEGDNLCARLFALGNERILEDIKPEHFYMLKPGPVTLERIRSGNGTYANFICCTIAYSRDGSEKIIKAKNVLDFHLRLAVERDSLMKDDFYLKEFKALYPDPDLKYYKVKYKKEIIEMEKTAKEKKESEEPKPQIQINFSPEFLQKYGIEQLDSAPQYVEEQERRSILDGFLDELNDSEKNFQYFEQTIKSKIGKGKLFSSKDSFTHTSECTGSYLTKILSQEKTPSRELVLRFGIALELSPDELKKFMNAAGYFFPGKKIDCIVMDILERGIRGYDPVLDEIYDMGPDAINELYKKRSKRCKRRAGSALPK